MSTDKRYLHARDIAAHFRGLAFVVTQSLRGKRPSRTVYNLTALWPVDQLTGKHIAYLLRAIDVPQLTANSYPTASSALRTLTAAIKAQPALHAGLKDITPRLLNRAGSWLNSQDESLRSTARAALADMLPLIDQPLPHTIARALYLWLETLQPDDPRRVLTTSLHRLNPPVLHS